MSKCKKTKTLLISVIDGAILAFILYGLMGAMTKIAKPDQASSSPKNASIEVAQKEQASGEVAPLLGIDVSHYQGDVQWDSVANDFHFSFVKATEGTEYVDPKMAENLHGLAKTTLQYGAYHFFLPDKDALEQAQHFLSSTRDFSLSLPPVLDVEVQPSGSKKAFIQGVKTWIATVEAATGCQPILYTNKSFWNDYLVQDFQDAAVWISDYTTHAANVASIPWKFWQFTDNGKAQGVSGVVDQSRYQGSQESLATMGACFI